LPSLTHRGQIAIGKSEHRCCRKHTTTYSIFVACGQEKWWSRHTLRAASVPTGARLRAVATGSAALPGSSRRLLDAPRSDVLVARATEARPRDAPAASRRLAGDLGSRVAGSRWFVALAVGRRCYLSWLCDREPLRKIASAFTIEKPQPRAPPLPEGGAAAPRHWAWSKVVVLQRRRAGDGTGVRRRAAVDVTYPGRAASGLRLAAKGDRPRAASACVAVVGRTGGRNTRWAWSDISVDLQRRSAEDGAGLYTGRCRTKPGGAASGNGVEAWSHSRPAPRPEDAFRVGHRRSSVLSIPPFLFLSISLSVEAVLITCLK
jgi:hypothetical protein